MNNVSWSEGVVAVEQNNQPDENRDEAVVSADRGIRNFLPYIDHEPALELAASIYVWNFLLELEQLLALYIWRSIRDIASDGNFRQAKSCSPVPFAKCMIILGVPPPGFGPIRTFAQKIFTSYKTDELRLEFAGAKIAAFVSKSQ
jgi:hypothetical protein